jgi:hypothetical protein
LHPKLTPNFYTRYVLSVLFLLSLNLEIINMKGFVGFIGVVGLIAAGVVEAVNNFTNPG